METMKLRKILLSLLGAPLLLLAPVSPVHATVDLNPPGIELPDTLKTGDPKERVGKVIIDIINIMLSFSAILAVAAIIWGAITLIISVGNDSKVGQAKKIITYAIIGLILTGLSFLIVRFIGQALGVV